MSAITGNACIEWLKRAGIVRDGERVRRVVIDVQVDMPVMVFKECYGDASMIAVDLPPLAEAVVNYDPATPICGHGSAMQYLDPNREPCNASQ